MTKFNAVRAAACAVTPLLMALAACARTDAAATDVVRADSSGVRIITSGAEDVALDWTFEDVDVLRDSVGEPWLFTLVYPRGVMTDRIGRTFVLLTQDPSIVRFGRDGRYEHSIGRRGSGPGEMQFPLSLGAKADTLVVLDLAKRSLVRWGSTFDALPDQRLGDAMARAEAVAFRFGGFWFSSRTYADSAVTLQLMGDTVSAPLHQVVVPNGGPVQMKCATVSQSTPMFAPDLLWAAEGARIVVNATAAYELWLHEGSRTIASIRRPLPLRAPTLEDAKLLWPEGHKMSFGGARPPCITPTEDLMKIFDIAPVMPLMSEVNLLSDGTIWVKRSWDEAPPVLDVFNADGTYAGTVRGMRMPVGLLPNGELLVPREDEMSGGFVIVRTKVTR